MFKPDYHQERNPSISLKVAEAHHHDAFRAVARIDEETLARIGACEGDTLIISGKRRAVARCMPLARIDLSSGINENNECATELLTTSETRLHVINS